MYSPARSLLTAVILGAVGSIAVASPAAACSVEGWSVRDAARKAAFIAEATVTRVEPDGIGLQVHRVLKGRAGGTTTVVGTAPDPIPNSSCSGRINVEVGDHVVFALADPATALGIESAIWWIEPDGSIERTSLATGGPRTVERLVSALRVAVPDTSTIHDAEAAADPPAPGLILFVVAAATGGLLAADRRYRRERTG